MLKPIDVEALTHQFRSSQPFPHIIIDPLVEPEFARTVAASYPTFEEAERLGMRFKTVNERNKIQVTDEALFPEPVRQLAGALAAPEFMRQIEQITGIPKLLWDPKYHGGGMHQTSQSGILDVHVDFNFIDDRFRRLNILVYLNEEWDEAWGGMLELWDQPVKVCHHSVAPSLGRAVIFETSERSFHGVTAVTCPPGRVRKSFAAYYYTEEAPAGYAGKAHSTIFRARPDEYAKKFLQMPAEAAQRKLNEGVRSVKGKLKGLLGR